MIDLLFDIKFDLSHVEINEEHNEDTFLYRGEACLNKESVEDLKVSWLVIIL